MSAEKVELEQVPLKSDTDAPAESEVPAEMTTDIDAEAVKPEQPKKKWFQFGKSGAKKADKPAAEAEGEVEAQPEGEEEKKDSEEAPKKEKKGCWWRRSLCDKQKKAEGEVESELQFGFDMVHRDERSINDHVALNFEDIFGEPDAVHSFDCVWRLTSKVFNACRLFFYRLFSLIVALPAAIVFALLFAVVHVFSVFCCTPAGRLFAVPAFWITKTWAFLVHAVFDPVFQSIGLCCGKKNFAGFSSAPTSDNIA